MNNYQQLQKNLHELKLTQISLQIDDYINKINEHKLSIVDALCELTSKEVWSYVNILDTKSQTFLCCTSS